jgi:hypothetical protein
MSNGWTDDLFPADESLRYYNRTRTQFPNAAMSLFYMDFGHKRGQNKAADRALLTSREEAWMDFYVRGIGSPPARGVEALTQTCPSSAPAAGPYSAPSWAQLAPGEVRLDSPAVRTILPSAGSPAIGASFDPVSGAGACVTTSATDQADTATYRSGPVPGSGYTLMGSPTVEADITSPGSDSQIAARLLDVDPGANTQTLVARGLWRPAIGASPVRQVFQLHPNGYRLAGGHVAKLELLPNDTPYGRTSNGQANVTVSNLQLRLPVLENPGDLGGLVQEPAGKLVPPGYHLARDFNRATYVRPKAATPLYVPLAVAYQPCSGSTKQHAAPLAFGSCPAQQASGFLTVGTADANGKAAESAGYVRLRVVLDDPSTPPDETDVLLNVSLTDVRAKVGLSDYTGELQAATTARITDRLSGSSTEEAATIADLSFAVTVPCAATPEVTGGTCATSTSFDAVMPGSAPTGSRAVWQLGQFEVYDGGADGLAGTAPNTLFARQGVFAP